MKRLLLLAGLAVAPAAHAQTTAWINEIHYDNSVTNDAGEAIEVVLPTGIPASGYSVVLYNGGATGGAAPYAPPTLTAAGFNVGTDCTAGSSYDANGDSVNDFAFYTCTFASANNGGLQNGAPDGLALVGPDPLNPAYPLVQYLSYEGTQGANGGPATGQVSQDIGVSETNTTAPGTSLQLGGSGIAYESFTWQASQTSTFGSLNAGQTLTPGTPTATSLSLGTGNDNLAGYRELAAPVGALRVNDLAGINLVQGVPGAGPFPAQYPEASPNLFTAYTESGGFQRPANTAQGLGLGRGFFWYLYDQNIAPNPSQSGGGTSQSVELPQTAALTGIAAPAAGVSGPDLRVAFSANALESYLIGNPLNGDFALSGISLLTSATTTTTPATLGTNFQVYDPSLGNYVALASTASLARGQGAWADVSGVAGGTTVRTFGFDFDAAGSGATFVGRGVAPVRVALALDGTVQTGARTTAVHDRAALVDFADSAMAAWDAGDASKLTPPGDTHALLAVVGERDGEPRRQAIRSLPTPDAPVAVRLAFATTHAGTFDVSAAAVPAGWTVRLVDHGANGRTADLASGPYTFAASAGDWSDRFSVEITPARGTASAGTPDGLSLSAVYPNPSPTEATLSLRVDAAQHVSATLIDALGRTVATVFDGDLAAGAEQTLVVGTSALAPGVYVVRVAGDTFAQSRRLTVLR